ncbi:acyltransferase family protein [Gracilibacillus salinarum]|uniref:Acyltransferase n=1 Tax=Gracilibacillus salinarum TaxID=2932255 RepID=A0ABY4GS25_9BACI|nr:acyltransferase [Gracilibacillus salinarum]UOQ87044.1 acyltransferase [Gracilibacillus salinarum]
MKYNHTIDAVKFICAILVVLIHVTAPIDQKGMATFLNYDSYRSFFDIAVPFFFAASGFFLAYKNREYLIGYTKKILYYYIMFSAFYIFCNAVLLVIDRLVLQRAFWPRARDLSDQWNYVNFLNGTIGSFHLWFLTALLFSTLLVYMLYKRRPEVILLVSFLAFTVNATGIFNFGELFLHGGVVQGFLYVSLGFYVGSKDLKIRSPLLWSIVFLVIYFIVGDFLKTSISIIFLFISVYYLLIFCKNNPGNESLISKLGKKYSLAIYILHVLILAIMKKVYIYAGLTYYEHFSFYLISSIVCVIVSVVIFSGVMKSLDKVFLVPFNHILNPEKRTQY